MSGAKSTRPAPATRPPGPDPVTVRLEALKLAVTIGRAGEEPNATMMRAAWFEAWVTQGGEPPKVTP
jgi:hypothetical protein